MNTQQTVDKVNLLINGNTPRAGYLNIDPLALPNDQLKVVGSVSNLDEYVDNAELKELIAVDILDYLSPTELNSTMNNWLDKIRHGGIITIGGVDIREVAKGLLKKELTVEEANILLYGEQTYPYQYRKATLTLQKIIDALQNRGFKIMQKRVENYSYSVKAERP